MKYEPCPGSAPGPFYVDAEACCDCESITGAPGLPFINCFGTEIEPETEQEITQAIEQEITQAIRPETEQEITQAIEAINSCPAYAIRYAGTNKTILDRITQVECCDVLCESDNSRSS